VCTAFLFTHLIPGKCVLVFLFTIIIPGKCVLAFLFTLIIPGKCVLAFLFTLIIPGKCVLAFLSTLLIPGKCELHFSSLSLYLECVQSISLQSLYTWEVFISPQSSELDHLSATPEGVVSGSQEKWPNIDELKKFIYAFYVHS
jgi:hypothetical protein